MTEHDRVLDAFRNCITEPKCKDCPWTECSTLDNGNVEIPRDLALAVMRELVAQERIDAIPIEWLKEHDTQDIKDSAGNSYGRRRITVVEALSMWQKEQEVRA